MTDPIVKLDVGGTVFETKLRTLRKTKDSLFVEIFKDYPHFRDPSGRYVHCEMPFIDRDPKYFPYILDFLRDYGSQDKTVNASILTSYIDGIGCKIVHNNTMDGEKTDLKVSDTSLQDAISREFLYFKIIPDKDIEDDTSDSPIDENFL